MWRASRRFINRSPTNATNMIGIALATTRRLLGSCDHDTAVQRWSVPDSRRWYSKLTSKAQLVTAIALKTGSRADRRKNFAPHWVSRTGRNRINQTKEPQTPLTRRRNAGSGVSIRPPGTLIEATAQSKSKNTATSANMSSGGTGPSASRYPTFSYRAAWTPARIAPPFPSFFGNRSIRTCLSLNSAATSAVWSWTPQPRR